MTEHDAARESRKSLVDAVAGKAKEVAGALTGKDELAQEGQLQQADAAARREANSSEALADAAIRESVGDLRDEQHEAGEIKRDAYRDAGAKERAVADEIEAEKAQAEQRARDQKRAEEVRSEGNAQAVAHDAASDAARLRGQAVASEIEADEDARRLDAEADDAERAAAALRAQTNTL